MITTVGNGLTVTVTGCIAEHRVIGSVPLMYYVPAVAAAGVAYGIVPSASVQYVHVRPAVLPAVIDAAVRSTVDGEQTAAGAVITTVGNGLTVTVTGCIAEHRVNGSVPLI